MITLQSTRGRAAGDALRVLVQLVTTDDLEHSRRRLAAVPPAQITALVDVARAHGVEAWLAACAPARDGAWAEFATQRPRFLGARARATAEAEEIGRALDADDCPWAVLKGLTIARSYPRPDLRHALDLDVLVPPQRFEGVVDMLTSAGYRLLDRNWPVLAARMPGQLRLQSRTGVLIDLHWHLLNQPELRDAFQLPTGELLQRAAPLPGIRLRALAPPDRLIHTALHAALAGGNRLLWLADVDRMACDGAISWPAVTATADAARAGLPVAVTLQRARRTLGTPIAHGVLAELGAGRTWRILQCGVDARRPLRPDPARPGVARAFARSAGLTGRRSQLALARRGLAWLRSGAPRSPQSAPWLDAANATSALHPVPDDSARAAYFAAVGGAK
jgi:hypothetical protein